MAPKVNLTGLKFNSLLVIEEIGRTGSGKVVWKCLCDCGEFSEVSTGNLKSGECKTCGCGMHKYKHGMAGTNFYFVWSAMKQRCRNPSSQVYKYYGGRGIDYCKDWENFDYFYRDMFPSYEEGLTLERIENDVGYSRLNCRWATMEEQSKNKRNTIK